MRFGYEPRHAEAESVGTGECQKALAATAAGRPALRSLRRQRRLADNVAERRAVVGGNDTVEAGGKTTSITTAIHKYRRGATPLMERSRR